MTIEYLRQLRTNTINGIENLRLQLARLEGALELLNLLIEKSEAPTPKEGEA